MLLLCTKTIKRLTQFDLAHLKKLITEWKLKEHVNLKKLSDTACVYEALLKHPMTEHTPTLPLRHTGTRYLRVQPFQPEAQDNLATS